MKLKYTIILLSLATPLAAETNCLQDNNQSLYEIISCLNNENQQLKSELAKVKENIFPPKFRDRLKDGSLGPEMVRITAGSFRMAEHSVSVEQFAMGKFEVTFAEYDKFAEATGRSKPSDQGWGRGNRPVINVSAYAKWLSNQTDYTYRLPTEAEWEYAVRAGTSTKYWWGNDIDKNNGVCRNCGDNFKYTSPVGSFSANPFGLYDTAGNLWEWTCSKYQEKYNGKEKQCIINARSVVLRGGSWNYGPGYVRSANRLGLTPTHRYESFGFRLVRLVIP
ncbi:formylglycine-generating enzyme family protein [Candidatus Marithrix sp. Canyon 246]|uniref:formylglycine-generating enzyme family protein n=1 Tax=Candidatus Marithrix sp. Canyon 246 TaxID=1827136 RepID=UPI00084A1A65|nr:SUMF1/EgtB/PvdO family nonheme iron enzyme [Candidatus Marithrix sp. Canyon 246]